MNNTSSSKHKIPDEFEYLVSERTKTMLDESGVTIEIEDQIEAGSVYPLYIAAFEDLYPLSGADTALDDGWREDLAKSKNFFTPINNWVKKNDVRCKAGKIHSWLIIRESGDNTGDFLYTDSKAVDADMIKNGVVVGFAYGDNKTIKEMVGSLNKQSSEAVLESALRDISLFYNNMALQISFRLNGIILDGIKNIPKNSKRSAVLEDRINKAILAIMLKNR